MCVSDFPGAGDETQRVRSCPLHVAVQHESHDCIAALLECAQVKVNAIDSNGRTPLHLAARQSDEFAIEVLLANGALPEVKDNLLTTPLEYARQKMEKETAEVIRDSMHRGSGAFGAGVIVGAPRAHAASRDAGSLTAANVRAFRKQSSPHRLIGGRKKGGYLDCKKCGLHHHWRSQCSTVAAKRMNGSTSELACRWPAASKEAAAAQGKQGGGSERPESAGLEKPLSHESSPSPVSPVSRKAADAMAPAFRKDADGVASKYLFVRKKRKKPKHERHTKPKQQAGSKPRADSDFASTSAREPQDLSDDFAERSGSDYYDGYGEYESTGWDGGGGRNEEVRMTHGGKRAFPGQICGGAPKCPRSDDALFVGHEKPANLANKERPVECDKHGLSGATRRRVEQVKLIFFLKKMQ
jgi:hypothetical protein